MRRIAAALLMLCVTAATVNNPAGIYGVKAAEVQEANTEETDILEAESSDFKYAELANGNLEIIKYKGNAEKLVIPSEIEGKKVAKIGEKAFRGCSYLKSITIPGSVKEIGVYDYDEEYTGLFDGCEALGEIIVEESNAWYSSRDGVLYDKEMTTLFYCPEGMEGSITIPQSVTNICSSSFYDSALRDIYGARYFSHTVLGNCLYLSEINVESDNTKYSSADGLLYSKDGTTLLCCPAGKQGNITILDSVTNMRNAPFDNCNRLTSITIPESTAYVEAVTFFGCNDLTDIIVDEKNEFYSAWNGILYQKKQEYQETKTVLIYCPAGKQGNVAIPDGVAEIGQAAFYGCSRLESIIMPKSITKVAYHEGERYEWTVFKGCSRLNEIVVAEDNEKYRSSAGALYYKGYSGDMLIFCPAGTNGDFMVQEGTKYIVDAAFSDCTGLVSVVIPKSVEGISCYNSYYDYEVNIFGDCINLKEIVIDEDNRSFSVLDGILYDDACEYLVSCPASKQGSIIVPQGVTGISTNAFDGCKKLTEINVEKNNKIFASIDGMLYKIGEDGALSQMIRCPLGKEGRITVADGVQTIGDYVFKNCLELKEIVTPSSIRSIGEGVFSGCGNNLCICCVSGSYAEKYAKERGMDYVLMEKKRQTITAYDHVKAIGDAAFPIDADTDGNVPLSYESSDEAVVSVSVNGIVTIHGEGTAEITIYAPETDIYEAAQKVITVTVNPASGTGENPAPPADLVGTSYDIGGCTYTITSVEPKEMCFTSLNDDCDWVLSIASSVTINGVEYEVSSIAERACCGMETLQRVYIGENVKEIGAGAFAGCAALEQVKIPESVQSIGEGAFAGCGDRLCMVCAGGSAAEAYAVENGIRHKASADEKEPQTIMADDLEKTFGDGPFPIGAATDGDGALSYESDNESVAVVSAKGTVILIGAGTARITIRASGTENYEPAEKTITITVNPKPGEDQNPDTGNNNQQNPENKKAQTITADDIIKTCGDKAFPIGAGSDGGGTLSYTVKNPAVAAIDGNGTVTLKGCGRTEIVITAAAYGEYTAAEKTITLTVAPKKLKGISAKPTKAGTLTVKWKKDTAASGYIIECSTDRKFRKNVKTATVKKNKTTSKKITKLKSGKKYYVRACAYAQAGGEKIKGAYTAGKKAVKVKR